MEDKELYLVLNQEKHGKLPGNLWLGYLPFGSVPVESPLWEWLRRGDLCYMEEGLLYFQTMGIKKRIY